MKMNPRQEYINFVPYINKIPLLVSSNHIWAVPYTVLSLEKVIMPQSDKEISLSHKYHLSVKRTKVTAFFIEDLTV